MLLVLVHGFESRRGEISIYLQKKKDQLLRAPSVGKDDASQRGKKAEIFSR